MNLLTDITGKTALVTGASSGLGKAIAMRLAEAGANVAVLGRDEATLEDTAGAIRAKGRKSKVFTSDIAQPGALARAVDQVASSFGALDILVNNAAVMFTHYVGETPRKRWEAMLNINLLALIEGSEAAIKHMRAKDVDGRIVNISSLAARLKGGGVYGASKAAVEKYTDELRGALENDSIRVTAIVPGGFGTNLGRDLSETEQQTFQRNMGPKLADATPDADGRTPYFGVPDDIARAVLFAVAQPSYLNISEIVVRPARNIDPDVFTAD